jgi:hypothetical protein
MEDLHDLKVVRSLYDFFGLARPDPVRLFRAARRNVNGKREIKRAVLASKTDALPAYDRWPARDRDRLAELCGETAAALGYDL